MITATEHASRACPIITDDPWLTAQESADLVGISLPTFWRRVGDKTFPRPVKLGNLSRWPRSEILDALERLKAARYAA